MRASWLIASVALCAACMVDAEDPPRVPLVAAVGQELRAETRELQPLT